MAKQQKTEGRGEQAFGIFRSREADWFLKWVLSFMSAGAAEIGECLYTANRIDERDIESWIRKWAKLAERVEGQGDLSLCQGHKISARESFWRASNYYAAAERGCLPSHPRFHELWEKSVACFHRACPLFDPPIQIVEISFEGKALPGYFWRPAGSPGPHPTLIVSGGADGTLEQTFFAVGPAAHLRQYNVFMFEFPGHRGAVHLYYPECVKRPDVEVPYAAAIDYLETLPGVDARLAMTGYSWGGYVTARVGAHEDRLRAIVPNSPLMNWGKVYQAAWSRAKAIRKFPPWLIDRLLEKLVRKSPLAYAGMRYTLWSLGTPDLSWSEILKLDKVLEYTVEHDLHKITCPTLALVGDGEGEEILRQARAFYEGISSTEKSIHVFSLQEDGANDHCQFDNLTRQHQVMFDWLDEVLGR